ncbi:MAG: hypothetical protein KF784_05010 [Fimbriimonadaceae bacterium]|nr:hypothetical protein [Fimbriimonadaceae bacterium]
MSSKLEYQRIGELLVADGFLTKGQLEKALKWQQRTRARFGEVLTELGFVREEQVAEAIARQFHHAVVDLSSEEVSPEAASLIDYEFATEHQCLALNVDDSRVLMAVSDPLDLEALDWVANKTRKKVQAVLATPTQLRRAIQAIYVRGKSKTERARKTGKRRDFDALHEMLDNQAPTQAPSRVEKGAA